MFKNKNKKVMEKVYTEKEIYNMLSELLSDVSEELIVAESLADAWNYAFDKTYQLLQRFHKEVK